jgi:hypothetical protein
MSGRDNCGWSRVTGIDMGTVIDTGIAIDSRIGPSQVQTRGT